MQKGLEMADPKFELDYMDDPCWWSEGFEQSFSSLVEEPALEYVARKLYEAPTIMGFLLKEDAKQKVPKGRGLSSDGGLAR